MNISQLRYFTTVAQLENVSKAADLLYMSQSSLSKNIAKLEEELGMPLFDRNGKKIALNPLGERFLECCNLLLRELDMALEDMEQLSCGTDNRIKICVAGVNQRIVDCMAAFRLERPEIEFDLDSGLEWRETLDINDFDVLIYPAGGRYDKYTGYTFSRERYYLAVAEGPELAGNSSISARALDGQDVVFLRNGKMALEYPCTICSAMAVAFRSQCFVDSQAAHCQMIASGMAIGFVTEEEAEFYQSASNIRLIPMQDQRFSRQMMICFRRDKHLSQAARDFRDYAVQYFTLDTGSRFNT